jgi:cytochrome c-type biogenesis protein CcmF
LDAQFAGEHLMPGKLGHFFAITSFVMALLSCISYLFAARTEDKAGAWKGLARKAFILHFAMVIGIFCTLYYIISTHLFEYHYAWEHSSKALPTHYLLSCFWEGQEGSFMLWTFWNALLGIIVMFTAKQLETRAMTIVALVQACLGTMLLGLYFGSAVKLGSTPFMLLRIAMKGAPIFASPNYLQIIKDGNGLNVLLQNYWMVIHPPILFLGFASTLIPFAYCLAALWKGEYKEFVTPTLAWSLFSGGILGLGIMMGGAWAYESLNFGGYWAWDPVENASLVPWLTLVAGIHTLLVYKVTGRSLQMSFVLLLLTHLLVWYSTFLTRTGVLGKTSVHAFTGEGNFLYWHLIAVLLLLVVVAKILSLYRWWSLPKVKNEEEVGTREFWMFIGSVVLLLSAVQIIFATSLPIWAPLAKWISGKDIAPPVDPMTQYNNIQVWVAIVLGLLSGISLYLKFKHTEMKSWWPRVIKLLLISGAATFAIAYFQKISTWQYVIMLWAACTSIVCSFYYAVGIQKAKLLKIGPATAHLGFGLVLLGILLSSYNKEVISFNTSGYKLNLGKDDPKEQIKDNRENVLLFKNIPVALGDYEAIFRGDSALPNDPRTFYRVDYIRRDSATKQVKESFSLYPTAFVNPKGMNGFIANPASKHYLHKDIFTFITSVYKDKPNEGGYKNYTLHSGDTIFLDKQYLLFKGFSTNVNNKYYTHQDGDIAVTALMELYDAERKLIATPAPVYYLRKQYEYHLDDTLMSASLFVDFNKIIPEKNAAEFKIKQTQANEEYITLKALVFPYINVLWLGVIIMVCGFGLSLYKRISKHNTPHAKGA